MSAHGSWPLFRLRRAAGETKQVGFSSRARPDCLVRTSPKRPAPACRRRRGRRTAARHVRKPVGWSMITIGVLVAVSATLVWRRDGIGGVLEILTHDLGCLAASCRACWPAACSAPSSRRSCRTRKCRDRSGRTPGLKGLLIGAAFGAILPGGPFTAYPVASALLAVGADFGATIAMVVSWTLIGYGRAVAWELPIMGTDFTLWRIVISLPLPVLAGALGRFVYVRMYPQAARVE